MEPQTYPLDGRSTALSALAWGLGACALALAVVAILVPTLLLPVGGAAIVIVLPAALAVYAGAGTAGRRALLALAEEHRGSRPSDAQMRRFLRDVDPWSTFWLYALITAAIVAGSALVAVIAIAASGGSVTELVVAITTAITFLVAVGVSRAGLRRAGDRGEVDAKRRDLLWPLPASSELLATLRSTGGDGGMSGPL